jgi:hypothetical protein
MRRAPGYDARSRPHVAEERWDEITLVPEADPIPLDVVEPFADSLMDVAIMGARVKRTFNDERSVELTCRLLVQGAPLMADGSRGPTPIDLPCYFRLPASGQVPLDSKFYRTWCMANGGRRPLRRDRMPFSVFKGRLFQGRVHIVTAGSEGPGHGETAQTPSRAVAAHHLGDPGVSDQSLRIHSIPSLSRPFQSSPPHLLHTDSPSVAPTYRALLSLSGASAGPEFRPVAGHPVDAVAPPPESLRAPGDSIPP